MVRGFGEHFGQLGALRALCKKKVGVMFTALEMADYRHGGGGLETCVEFDKSVCMEPEMRISRRLGNSSQSRGRESVLEPCC